MTFSNQRALLVRELLVFLVVTMVRVEQILELADLMLHVNRLDLDIVQVGSFQLMSKLGKWMAHLILEAPFPFAIEVLSLWRLLVFHGIAAGHLLVRMDVRSVSDDHLGGRVESATLDELFWRSDLSPAQNYDARENLESWRGGIERYQVFAIGGRPRSLQDAADQELSGLRGTTRPRVRSRMI